MIEITKENKALLTVPFLKANGCKVHVIHSRFLKDHKLVVVRNSDNGVAAGGGMVPIPVLRMLGITRLISPTGGYTTAHVLVEGENEWRFGQTDCNSRDVFSYKEGTRIALEKAFGVYDHQDDAMAAELKRMADKTKRDEAGHKAKRAYWMSVLTTANGLIYKNGVDLTFEAGDLVAQQCGLVFAEELVKELEAKQKENKQ